MPTIDNLKNMLILVLSLTLIILFAYFRVEVYALKKEKKEALEQVASLASKIDEQNASILDWKQKSDDKDLKLKQVQKQINQRILRDNKNLTDLQLTDVSPICDKAILWSIEQGRNLK